MTWANAIEKNDKKKREQTGNPHSFSLVLVGLPGFEPGKAGPESAVLPLHHSPIVSLLKAVQRYIFF